MSEPLFIGVHHVGITAHNIARQHAFHVAALALQGWPQLDAMALPGAGVALAGPNAGVRLLGGGTAPLHRPVSEAGITHLCLQSPRIEALHAAFAAAGAGFHNPLLDLGTGFRYCYARDPEHNVIELEGVADVWADGRPWLAHVNVAAAEMPRLCDFYAALFESPCHRSPRLRGGPEGDVRLDQIAALEGVELRMAWIGARNMQIELIRYTQPTAVATGAHSTRRVPHASGHAYIALEVAELDAACARVQQLGGRVLASASNEDSTHPALRRTTDPEGNPLWLLDSRALQGPGAAIGQLAQPDIVPRFEAARHARTGSP